MNLYSFADKIVFRILQDINSGYLEITSFDGEIMKFGNPEDALKAYIIIKKPNFTFSLIKGGSIGFAESYMRNEFETKYPQVAVSTIKSNILLTICRMGIACNTHFLPCN